ncbi:unnamed protein product, partial [Scytosiphon promiscuus]
MTYIAGRRVVGEEASDSGTRPRYLERVPRGQCHSPVAPAPDPTRGEAMKQRDNDTNDHAHRRRSSQIVVISQGGGPILRKPTPKWKNGYIGFKRKVKSSALVPLLLTVSLCGAGAAIVGLTGISSGFFTWTVGCEGVVTVTGDSERANGVQTYSIGWVQYRGEGPSTTSDSPTLPVDSSDDNNNGNYNATAGSDLGYGGVAGSSIHQEGWLAEINHLSAVFGVMAALGHVIAFAFFSTVLFT